MKKRDYNLDLIKFIAIIATISIHVLSAGSRADLFSKTWIFFVFSGSLFRFCVPVFCMCAGYLLYTKEKIDFKSIYKKIFKFFVRFSMNKPPAMLVVGILALASSKKPPVINY